MNSMKDREQAFESKYKNDQELQFKITMRRNKLLGLWAAEQLGLVGATQEAYAKEVVISDLEVPGDQDVIDKIIKDFQANQIDMSEHRIRREMETLYEIARKQVTSEN